MLYGLAEEHIEKIKTLLKDFEKIDQVIIFGSRAKGNYKPASDVDLAIKGNSITLDDILSLTNKIEELNFAYKFDLINYNTIDNKDLIEHINRVGKVFYSRT